MNWIRRHKPTGTIVCRASNPKNLHSEYGKQLGLSDEYEDAQADFRGECGDKLVAGKVVDCVEQRVKRKVVPDRIVELEARIAQLEARIR